MTRITESLNHLEESIPTHKNEQFCSPKSTESLSVLLHIMKSWPSCALDSQSDVPNMWWCWWWCWGGLPRSHLNHESQGMTICNRLKDVICLLTSLIIKTHKIVFAAIIMTLELDPDGLMTRVQACVTDRWTDMLKMCVINSHTDPSQDQSE